MTCHDDDDRGGDDDRRCSSNIIIIIIILKRKFYYGCLHRSCLPAVRRDRWRRWALRVVEGFALYDCADGCEDQTQMRSVDCTAGVRCLGPSGAERSAALCRRVRRSSAVDTDSMHATPSYTSADTAQPDYIYKSLEVGEWDITLSEDTAHDGRVSDDSACVSVK